MVAVGPANAIETERNLGEAGGSEVRVRARTRVHRFRLVGPVNSQSVHGNPALTETSNAPDQRGFAHDEAEDPDSIPDRISERNRPERFRNRVRSHQNHLSWWSPVLLQPRAAVRWVLRLSDLDHNQLGLGLGT